MGQDDLGCHTAKDKGHRHAKQNQPVLAQERRIRGEKPREYRDREYNNRRPLKEHGQNGEVLSPPSDCDIIDTRRQMCGQKREKNHGDPKIEEDPVPKKLRMAPVIRHAVFPDLRPIIPGRDHHRDGNEKTFRGTIEIPQIQRVGVVCFPCGKEHGQARDEGREGPQPGGA